MGRQLRMEARSELCSDFSAMRPGGSERGTRQSLKPTLQLLEAEHVLPNS